MPLTFELDPPLTHELSDGLCALWADVTNADGAVGFVPPVTAEDIRPQLMAHLAAVDDGRSRVIVGREEPDGAVAASAFIGFNTHRLKRHWATVFTVMVHPAHQGKGYGRELMATVEKAARGLDGILGLRLTCRGGRGLESFYGACGYREVGRLPGGIQVADGDYRDDVTFWLPLG